MSPPLWLWVEVNLDLTLQMVEVGYWWLKVSSSGSSQLPYSVDSEHLKYGGTDHIKVLTAQH